MKLYQRIYTAYKKDGLRKIAKGCFDIIFLDPPYQTDYIKQSIELIDKYNLLNKNGLLICESDAKEKLCGYKNYQEVKTRKYGQKIVVILKN